MVDEVAHNVSVPLFVFLVFGIKQVSDNINRCVSVVRLITFPQDVLMAWTSCCMRRKRSFTKIDEV
jgi:hypothetical protein